MVVFSPVVGNRMIVLRRASSAKVLSGMYLHIFQFRGSDSRSFSEVHKAKHRETGRMVALKRILMHNEKEGMPVTALREIKILKALKHKNVVELLDMFVVHSMCSLYARLVCFAKSCQAVRVRTSHCPCTWCSRIWTMISLVYSRTPASRLRPVISSFI